MKKEPIKEPCHWWFYTKATVDGWGNPIPDSSTTHCGNKKSVMYLSRICSPQTRESCKDYEV